ncbi:uncharacterized protein LOC132559351 isoform X2 [Ylistrum balloti]|uniref:uncharacterized protein LOC132559351 isoform X2 n=1 Tax=Ylistrum balloti TaxID=509963 RepID=UPI002905C5D2|nr:uncharacterized protein LOC132559351 isoform X2 [Ylistrum balloti]
MAKPSSLSLTDEEKICLERTETCCADILREVITCKVGSTQCPVFCRKLSKECKSFTVPQCELLRCGDTGNFDAALCIKVIRKIKVINPRNEQWKSQTSHDDHSLFASIKRIFRFLKEAVYSPDETNLSFKELCGQIETAFQDIQEELHLERNFAQDLNTILAQLPRPASIIYDRLASQVETDAVADNDIDPAEYSFLYRFTPTDYVRAVEKIRLIRKYKDRFHPNLKAPQSDVMVVYAKQNKDAVETFRRSIDGHPFRLNGNNVKARAVLFDDERFEGTALGSLEEAYNRSTFAFLYLTKEFIKNDYRRLVADSLLMDSINNEHKKWRVVPFHTATRESNSYKVPLGINTLKSECVFEQDEFYWNRMEEVLGNKIHEREDRELEMLEEEYQEAVRIQNTDERHRRGLEKLSLQDEQLPHHRLGKYLYNQGKTKTLLNNCILKDELSKYCLSLITFLVMFILLVKHLPVLLTSK